MGLWNFVKNAGKKVFGAAEAAEAPAEAEAAIKQEVQDLGLDHSGLDLKVDGDKVVLSGQAVSQEVKEKIILAAGNVDGIAAVEDTAAAPDAREPIFHTVEKGDTLWAIASKHLGNGADYMKIFEANRPMLGDPDKIYPGQMLRIPQG